jgi:hypothetical protein
MTRISQSGRQMPPLEPVRPSEHMPSGTAVASLAARVSAARILREHHVWEAARILPDAAGLPDEAKHAPELHALMEKDAFAAALRLLARSCQPPREFGTLDQENDRWIAMLVGTGSARRKRFVRAEHRDAAAAMLIALLRSAATGKSAPPVHQRPVEAGRQ